MIKHLALCLLSVHFSSKLLAQDNGYMKEAILTMKQNNGYRIYRDPIKLQRGFKTGI